MKIIKLFLLLSLGLWGEFKLDIPNEIDTEQLQYIIENGWNDKNETLNNFIVKYGEKTLPDALERLKKPLVKMEPTKEDPASTPKILLHRDDYLLIFSYLKYLENQNKNDQALKIYKTALNGTDEINDKTMISLIVKIVYNQIAVESLKNFVDKKNLIIDEKNELKKILINSPMMTEEYFFEYLKFEQKGFKRVLKDNLTDASDLKLYNSLVNYYDQYFAQMVLVMKTKSNEKVDEFEKLIQKETNEYQYCIEEIKLLRKNNSDISLIQRCSIDNLGKALALAAMPKLYTIFKDYLKNIEERKKLIQLLQ